MRGAYHGRSSYTARMRTATLLLLFALPGLAQERVDLGVVDRIKTEAFDHSKVMDHLYQMTEVHGPRLTWSSGYQDAANWAESELKGMGLENVHLEKWAPGGRNWTLHQSSVELLEPRYQELTAVPLAWSASTNGPVTGELVLAPFRASFRDGPKKYAEAMKAYQAKWTGKLRGKIVLLSAPQGARAPDQAAVPPLHRGRARRHGECAGARREGHRQESRRAGVAGETRRRSASSSRSLPNSLMEQLYDLYDEAVAERARFLAKEGRRRASCWKTSAPTKACCSPKRPAASRAPTRLAPPTFVVTAEQYDRIARSVEKKLPVAGAAEPEGHDLRPRLDGMNIIGEIPGGAKKDEIVMIGAHFDSWHSGTGATDNGAGSAVMMEVMRILEGAPPEARPHRAHRAVGRRRGGTVRLARLREGALRRSARP